MNGAEDGAFELSGVEFDPDALLWVRGVDYVAGWRDARGAIVELETALAAVGIETEGPGTAQTRGDGSGVVRLLWSPATVRTVAQLLRKAS